MIILALKDLLSAPRISVASVRACEPMSGNFFFEKIG